MGRNFGYFLITVGLIFLLVQLGFLNFSTLKALVSTPYFIPLAFIVMGVSTILAALLPIYKPVNNVLGIVFFLLIITWLFSGFSALNWIFNSFFFPSTRASSFDYEYATGASIDFSAGEIVIARINETHFLMNGSAAGRPEIKITGNGALIIEGAAGSIIINSLPESITSVKAGLAAGSITYNSSGEDFTSKYSIALGAYSDPTGRICKIACDGQTIQGIGGRELDFELVVGEVRIT